MNEEDAIYDAALTALERGWSIIPVSRTSKIPAVKWKQFQDERPTRELIYEWFVESPCYYNIGLVTGPISRVAVLDCDPAHGGRASLQRLGLNEQDATVITGSGGTHFYYGSTNFDAGCSTGLLAGIDFKCKGGYVVLPPSIHCRTGKPYEWNKKELLQGDPPKEVIPAAPIMYANSVRQNSAGQLDVEYLPLETAASGGRNNAAAKIAGRLMSQGVAWDKILQIMDLWNSENSPPLDNKELMTVIQSIKQYHKEKYA